MSDLDLLVKKYTANRSKKIQSICSPLNQYLGINTFSYFSIESNGNFATFSNNPAQLEYYYFNKLYLQNPFMVHPDLLRSGYVWTKLTQSEEYQLSIESAYEGFHLHNPFLILHKDNDKVEGFFFGTDSRAKLDIDYLDHIELLEKFSAYLLREAEPLILQIRAETFNLLKEKGVAFLERNSLLPLSNSNNAYNDFLQILSPLSKREKQCLDLFQKGHSAQSTAALLGLSQRTVEHYFENIKDKLGCYSKSELLNH